MAILTLTAVLHQEDDLYVAECPEVGTVSQGYSLEEAVANLREATELYLEEFSLPQVGRPILPKLEAAVSAAIR
jgi:predicted RNase H-like HicB family nuclease